MKESRIKIMSVCAAIAILCAMLASCADPSRGKPTDSTAPVGTEPKFTDNEPALDTMTPADSTPDSEKEFKSIIEKYTGYTTEQLYESLINLPKDKLTEEIKQAFSELSDVDIDALIGFAIALRDRINEYTEEEIIEMIMDDNNDSALRWTLIDIYGDDSLGFKGKTENGNKTIRALLSDDSVDDKIKTYIILSLDFDDEEGQQMLRDIAASDNEDLAKFANKILKY